MSARGTRAARLSAVAAFAATGLLLAGCTGSSDTPDTRAAAGGGGAGGHSGDNEAPAPKPTSIAQISANVQSKAADVPVDRVVTVSVKDGDFDKVVLQPKQGKKLGDPLAGDLDKAGTTWTAENFLEPGTRYVVTAAATDPEGLVKKERIAFSTDDLTLAEQTYPSIIPLDGEVVGVGMPVIVTCDIPLAKRAEFERHMHVRSTPQQPGSWHWISDQEVHWRPKHYWRSGTKVDVDLQINSLAAGNGVYGQMDRSMSFTVGRSVVIKQNIAAHSMKVYVDGDVARTIPITAGKNGFETRSGVKLISEKFEEKRMDAATVGIDSNDPEYYNIPDVQYAQRVTNTGEFIHAAPWSVDAQGSYNVSHGCVGISVENAKWLFGITQRGTPVEVKGTDRGLEPGNGWTDWNQSFKEYRQASAL